jgi:hypothetical protein
MRFSDPARPVPAVDAAPGAVGPALADLAAVINGDLPRLLRDQLDGGFLPVAQFQPAE